MSRLSLRHRMTGKSGGIGDIVLEKRDGLGVGNDYLWAFSQLTDGMGCPKTD